MLHLTPSEGNPVPPDAVLMPVRCADQITVRAAFWPCIKVRARGTVCLLQGRAETIEKYFEVITLLRQRGFAVLAFDWRGQGGSDRLLKNRAKGHIANFAHYRRDMEAVFSQILEPLLPKPFFGLAHSMGGAIALAAAREQALPFKRLVTTAPMLALTGLKMPRLARYTADMLQLAGLGRCFVPFGGPQSIALKPFENNILTGDVARYHRNALLAQALGDGAIGDPTIGWVAEAFRLMDRFASKETAQMINIPTLILASGNDPLISTPFIERFAASLKTSHALVIRGARHEIMMEREALFAQFWAAFDAFIPGSTEIEHVPLMQMG
jgi:lysophospholipase